MANRRATPAATYCSCAHLQSLDSRYVHHSAIAWECKWHYCSGIVPHCRRENHNSARPKCHHWCSPKSDRTVSIRRCTSCRWHSETRSTDRQFRLAGERRTTVSHSIALSFPSLVGLNGSSSKAHPCAVMVANAFGTLNILIDTLATRNETHFQLRDGVSQAGSATSAKKV